MVSFKGQIEKFNKKGEKTGWTYVTIPLKIADKINKGVRKSYRVKGSMDDLSITGISLIPMGEGDFIIPLNAAMRKVIRKSIGESIHLKLELDKAEKALSEELVTCLEDDPVAHEAFYKMPKSHQRYFSNWIESAKTPETRVKRITKTMVGLSRGLSFGEIMKLDV